MPLNVTRLAMFSAVEPGIHGQVRSTGNIDGRERRVVHVEVEDVRLPAVPWLLIVAVS